MAVDSNRYSMTRRSYDFTYNGRPISKIIDQNVPHPRERGPGNDLLVYIMGPYTAFDARRVYDKAGNLESPFYEDPLFDPKRHVRDGKGRIDLALASFRDDLQENYGVRAFIATDVNIPIACCTVSKLAPTYRGEVTCV